MTTIAGGVWLGSSELLSLGKMSARRLLTSEGVT